MEAVRAARELAAFRDATVITSVDAADHEAQQTLAAGGFAVHREEVVIEIDLMQALGALREASLPPGVGVLSAAEADVDQLRELDDELRGDVPGTSGWQSSPAEFRANTFDDPAFDPATYLVAVDDDSGDYVGLVRVWMNPGLPRIGMVGVRRACRRRGIGVALLAHALTVVRARGATRVTAEFDRTNEASGTLSERVGARIVRTTVELAYPS